MSIWCDGLKDALDGRDGRLSSWLSCRTEGEIRAAILDLVSSQETLRDKFAAKAMQALVGTCGGPALGGLDGMEPHTANAAYKMADAMLKAREEKP